MRFFKGNIHCGFVFLLLLLAMPIAAAEKDTTVVENFSIFYKADSVKVNPNYLDNSSQIERILHYLNNSPRIDSITIHAYASPEGSYKSNKVLSDKRAKDAKRYLLRHSPDSLKLNSDKIKIDPRAENWSGLLTLVEEKYFEENRETVLKILRDTTVGDETRKWRLQNLNSGMTWRHLIDNYMPELRAATWTCVWAEVIPPLALVDINEDTLSLPSAIEVPQPVRSKAPMSRTIAAVKTNLLYDAATALNFAVEVPFGKQFSVLYEQIFPWWLTPDNKYCFQFLSFGGEVRWWFAPTAKAESSTGKHRDALVGHFVGLNCWGGKSDIQIGRKFGCYQFDFVSAGLSYGYSMPVGKHLNLEFSLSAGYARIPYQHYIPTDDWQILIKDTHNAGVLHYFGPTKAQVSLTLPIRATFRKEVKHE